MSEHTKEGSKIQGGGDKEAAREYNRATQEFVESGRVEEAAAQARDQDPGEAESAEQAGRERAKEKDPAVHRNYAKPTED